MSQLSILLPKDQLNNFLTFAGQEELLHILSVQEKSLPSGADRYDTTDLVARSTAIRNRLSSLGSVFGNTDSLPEKLLGPVEELETLADFLDKQTAALEQLTRQVEESAAKLQAELGRGQELARFVGGLESMGISLNAIGGGAFLTMLAGEIARGSVQLLQTALDGITYGNLVFATTSSSETTQTFIAIVPSPFEEEARQAITAVGNNLESSWADLPNDPVQARKVIDNRLKQTQDATKQLEDDRKARVKELGPRWKALTVLSEILEIRVRALSGSSATESTCMLQAWVPEDKVQQLTDGAAKACNGLVSVHTEKELQRKHSGTRGDHQGQPADTREETPPTLVRVPRWAQPMQSIINNFGTPSYHEMNPLPFMIISYPLIFGLMFGDFGQGPIFIALGLLFLRAKRKGTRVPGGDIGQLIVGSAELMILLGIGITIFGFVFGDFFGFESSQLFGLNPLFNPTKGALEGNIERLQQFMIIILYFGVAHYTLGLSLSTYEKIRHHEYSEAFFGPICWAWFYLAFINLVAKFVLAGNKFSALLSGPLPIAVAQIALFFIPFGLLAWKEGGLHAIEAFTSIGSNTLSYLRIWALNIADYFVKYALFTAGIVVGPILGIPPSIGGIIGAVFGNLLVMIIEGLIVFVQTLRLHWVEWFSKFYEGNGLSFAPYREPKSWVVPVSG